MVVARWLCFFHHSFCCAFRFHCSATLSQSLVSCDIRDTEWFRRRISTYSATLRFSAHSRVSNQQHSYSYETSFIGGFIDFAHRGLSLWSQSWLLEVVQRKEWSVKAGNWEIARFWMYPSLTTYCVAISSARGTGLLIWTYQAGQK